MSINSMIMIILRSRWDVVGGGGSVVRVVLRVGDAYVVLEGNFTWLSSEKKVLSTCHVYVSNVSRQINATSH
jgi:hypothetical protein